jgi:ABC-2 type transport system ATP-binding protein
VEEVAVEAATLRCLLRGEPDALLKEAARHHVVHWTAQDRELEALFLDFYRVPAEELHTPEEVGADAR